MNQKKQMPEGGLDLPNATKVERALDVAAGVASIVPWLGGPVSSVLEGMSIGRKMNRVRLVLEGLASDLKDLRSEASENYVRTEDFEDILESTLKRVADERDDQKLAAYRAFLRTAIKQPGAASYDDLNQVLRSLSELRPIHLQVLRAMDQEPEPGGINSFGHLQTLRIRLPGSTEEQLLDALADLNRLGLAERGAWKMMMTPHGAADLRHLVTRLGQRLLLSIKE